MPDDADLPQPDLTPEERDLGMDADITRRDFLNAVALGNGSGAAGHASTGAPPPPTGRAAATAAGGPRLPWHPWTGDPGIGDYAISNGNTWDVVSAAHGLRDGTYERDIAGAIDTGEVYDLVIVGGGFSGTVAAYTFFKETGRSGPASCSTTTRSSAARPSATSSSSAGSG